MIAIAAGAVILTGRLAQLQILDHAEYAAEARLIHLSQNTLSDRRGALLDRNGYPLAGSEDSFDVYGGDACLERPGQSSTGGHGAEPDSGGAARGDDCHSLGSRSV